MKTKLHLLAGESILNTDGENHHHGHDQLAKGNITTESTEVHSVVHPFGGDEAAKHAWMRGFYEAAKAEGQFASVEFTGGTFFIRELDAGAPGAACSVLWDIGNCLCVANEPVKHTGLKVEPCFLQTTPLLNGRSGPTPASLTKMVEAQNLMSNIKRWSRQNAPNNEVWAAAAASVGLDMDADSGSGSGGGAMEARFKALEDKNVKLRQEMGGVVSTVKDLVMTVKDMEANMNMGFAQLMQANQKGSAALLTLTCIQGTDASVVMIGHAVPGLPGTSFVMPDRFELKAEGDWRVHGLR